LLTCRVKHHTKSYLSSLVTGALLKDAETRLSALSWLGAVLASNASAVEPASVQPGMESALARARAGASAEATLVNLSLVLLQLCAPFLDPSDERNGKGHDGYDRLDTRWLLREKGREGARRKAGARYKAPPHEPTLRTDGAAVEAADAGAGAAGDGEAGGDG